MKYKLEGKEYEISYSQVLQKLTAKYLRWILVIGIFIGVALTGIVVLLYLIWSQDVVQNLLRSMVC